MSVVLIGDYNSEEVDDDPRKGTISLLTGHGMIDRHQSCCRFQRSFSCLDLINLFMLRKIRQIYVRSHEAVSLVFPNPE